MSSPGTRPKRHAKHSGKIMKEETFRKPPLLMMPPEKPMGTSFRKKENFLEERAVQKFTARYDAFQGILRRVSEMKLNGSLDSEEPSTGSEKSGSSCSGQPKRRPQSRTSSVDNPSSSSVFEDESSASSITGSDHCSPYEEIPRGDCGNRYSCSSLPSYPAYARTNAFPCRESFPSPPSPTDPAKEYKTKGEAEKRSFRECGRPKSLVGGGGRVKSSSPSNANVDGSKVSERRLSLEHGGQPESISEVEKHQLEMFFRSLKTDVFVCGSLANLYFGWKEEEGHWSYRHTGVVVVVFDFGDTRCRNKRKIQIMLAERGTCFPLWKDTIDNLSAYHKSGTAFHTMYLSSDHRQMVGLSFDSASEADALLVHLEELTSNPENINISVPGSRKKKKPRPKKQTIPLPHKKHISNPCLFQHLTSVAAKDKPMYMSMQTLIDSENIKKEETLC